MGKEQLKGVHGGLCMRHYSLLTFCFSKSCPSSGRRHLKELISSKTKLRGLRVDFMAVISLP